MILKHLFSAKGNRLLRSNYGFQKVLHTSYKSNGSSYKITASKKENHQNWNSDLSPVRLLYNPEKITLKLNDFQNHATLAMSNNLQTRNIFDILYEYNRRTNQLITYDDLARNYGSTPLQHIFNILEKAAGKSQPYVMGPNTYIDGNMWKSDLMILWPHMKLFSGVALTKETAEYNCFLAGVFWLNKYQNFGVEGLVQTHATKQNVQESPVTKISPPQAKTLTEKVEMNNTNLEEPGTTTAGLFPKPKETLQLIFNALSKDMNENTKILKAKYIKQDDGRGRIHWSSSYHLEWPESLDFYGAGRTKSEASSNAALSALLWLKLHDHITNDPLAEVEGVKSATHPKTVDKAFLKNLLTETKPQESPAQDIKRIYFENYTETEVQRASQLFPSPKEFLHTFYRRLSLNLKSASLKIRPTFDKVVLGKRNVQWVCSYIVHWPESMKFVAEGKSKKESSTNAALSALMWLRDNDKLKELSGRQPKLTVNLNFFRNLLNHTLIGRNLQQARQMSTMRGEARSNGEEHVIPPQNDEPNEQTPNEKTFFENEETKSASRLFPSAKSTLHNIFDVVSKELNMKSYKLTPQYKVFKAKKQLNHWICTYELQWPESMKFNAKGVTKQEASHKAALSALIWLKNNQKITKDGQPLLYSKNEVKQLKLTSLPVLKLSTDTVENLDQIKNVIRNDFVKNLSGTMEDNFTSIEDGLDEETGLVEHGDTALKATRRIKFLNESQYLAKEKVKLPISDYKNKFIDLLDNNQVVIVKGEPGCGKSTRIPQYVLESWVRDANRSDFCRIAVTQPRRISAISLAERVARERDESIGSIVGYQVRFKANFQSQTGRILYCTTGILLRQLQSDLDLQNFSHIILDEAHERDVNTDLLMNLLRIALETNPNLKLVVMSATIDTGLFQDYFDNAPILEVPGFTYPVKAHYLNTFPSSLKLQKSEKMCESTSPAVVPEDVATLIKAIHEKKNEGAILCFLPGWDDIVKVSKLLPRSPNLSVLCLHSRLNDSDQWKIFSRPPNGVRKVILATNIAETSVTIDDVVYVIDTGIHKEQRFDTEKGVMCLDNYWISKASAIQRRGRAGRCQAGECFHLYPKHKFDSFSNHALPEILRTSLTKIVLDSKVFSNNMNAMKFMSQLVCPPEEHSIRCAVDELKDLELLDDNERLTPLGRTLSSFQLEPKLSKAMVNSVIYKCVTPVVDIVTLFASDTELFSGGLLDKEASKMIKQKFSNGSDHLAVMRLLESWLDCAEANNGYELEKLSSKYNLVPHKMNTLQKLRTLHFEYLHKGLYDVMAISDDLSDNDELVKAVVYSGVGTLLQHRNWDIVKNRIKNNVNVLITRNNHKAILSSDSVNYKRYKYPSDFLMYINETRSNIRRTTIIRESSLISPLSALLFSNKKMRIVPMDKENFSSKINSTQQVEIGLNGTNVKFICDELQAQKIQDCKESLAEAYQYFIFQLTKGGDYNAELNKIWDGVLRSIDKMLTKNNVD